MYVNILRFNQNSNSKLNVQNKNNFNKYLINGNKNDL